MTPAHTSVLLLQVAQRCSWRLLFGQPRASRDLTLPRASRARSVFFAPRDIFGLSRRRLNEFGTVRHEVLVLRACAVGQSVALMAGVAPGAELLLHTTGADAARALDAITLCLELGIDLTAEPDFVEELHVLLNGRVFPKRRIESFATRGA